MEAMDEDASSLSRRLSRRILLANALVLAAAFALLVLTPITVSAPVKAIEAVILFLGVLALIAVNWRMMRRMMLKRFAAERMQTVRTALAAQESERLRVARELHDEVGQGLIAVALLAERAAGEAPPGSRDQFEEIAERVHFYLDELRRIAHELRPEMLDDLGLLNALIALAADIGVAHGVAVERDLPQALPDLTQEQELVLYRIAQEGLANAAHHSGGSRIGVRLIEEPDALDLEVTDNGRGIGGADQGDGVGIKGMHERARLIGGTLHVGLAPSRGTRVHLRMPLRSGGI